MHQDQVDVGRRMCARGTSLSVAAVTVGVDRRTLARALRPDDDHERGQRRFATEDFIFAGRAWFELFGSAPNSLVWNPSKARVGFTYLAVCSFVGWRDPRDGGRVRAWPAPAALKSAGFDSWAHLALVIARRSEVPVVAMTDADFFFAVGRARNLECNSKPGQSGSVRHWVLPESLPLATRLPGRTSLVPADRRGHTAVVGDDPEERLRTHFWLIVVDVLGGHPVVVDEVIGKYVRAINPQIPVTVQSASKIRAVLGGRAETDVSVHRAVMGDEDIEAITFRAATKATLTASWGTARTTPPDDSGMPFEPRQFDWFGHMFSFTTLYVLRGEMAAAYGRYARGGAASWLSASRVFDAADLRWSKEAELAELNGSDEWAGESA